MFFSSHISFAKEEAPSKEMKTLAKSLKI